MPRSTCALRPADVLRSLALGVALSLVACATGSSDPSPTAPREAQPPAAASAAHAPLPNLHRLTDRILSGGQPDGEAGFAELAALGVRTVISVDGAAPDVAGAAAYGLRYVHIPLTYAEVNEAEQLELARAVRDLPGPVYVHCHHGKHRSPAASAAAGVVLGAITPEEGVAFMKKAGTAASYEGLYACVSLARAATPEQIDAAPATFPAVREPEGIVAAMVAIDHAFEHLAAIARTGWQVPADHPDLVPAAEAGRLADGLRIGGEDPDVAALGDAFARRMADAVEKATALEEAIVAGAPASELDARFALVRTSCKDCHGPYRDRR